LLGLFVSLFGRRHRIWVRVTANAGDSGDTGYTMVHIAGLTRSPGLDNEIKLLAESIEKGGQ
jgi:hypothetical protein